MGKRNALSLVGVALDIAVSKKSGKINAKMPADTNAGKKYVSNVGTVPNPA